MHTKNIHNKPYDFKLLIKEVPELSKFIDGSGKLNFSNSRAVYLLNKALLQTHYNIKSWQLPDGYLCPPIPGRADYIHHLNDLVNSDKPIKGLDIGTGASAIYPLLGKAIYNWEMVGCDSNEPSIKVAKANTANFKESIEIKLQSDKSFLFKGIIQEGEYYDFTMCNPPFYNSLEEALKVNASKRSNLKIKNDQRNFAGLANELYCNGGEALFIKRMIKESVQFQRQVGWFTCLLSRKQNLPKVIKQLTKLKATHKIVNMEQGNKKSRFIAWKFTP